MRQKKRKKKEYCEILVTEWKAGQVVAGQIIFERGKLRFTATNGYEGLMKDIVESKTFVGGKAFDPATDPKGWLHSLPSAYTGMVLRARLVSSEPQSNKHKRSQLARKKQRPPNP